MISEASTSLDPYPSGPLRTAPKMIASVPVVASRAPGMSKLRAGPCVSARLSSSRLAPMATRAIPTGTPQEVLPLRDRKRQRAREAIIDTALDLFAEHGFAEVSVDDMVKRAEVGRTTFFATSATSKR